jgi:predicted O-linked N-acetylglucosamine transferase (SPINDLY family)
MSLSHNSTPNLSGLPTSTDFKPGSKALTVAFQQHRAGYLAFAEARYRQILAVDATCAESHYLLGLLLLQSGRDPEALPHLAQAASLQPDNALYLASLGFAQQQAGQWPAAVDSYRRAVTLNPDEVDYRFQLGLGLARLDRAAEAMPHLQQVTQRRPDKVLAHYRLAQLLEQQGHPQAAVAAFQRAIERHPSNQLRLEQALVQPVIYQSRLELQDWRRRLEDKVDRLLESGAYLDPQTELAPVNFWTVYQGLDDRALQEKLARLYPSPADPRPDQPNRSESKIRVGLVSAYFKRHTIGRVMRGLIAQLSRQDFHVTVLSVGNHDDEFARFIQQQADAYLILPPEVSAARQLIAGQALDVLVYTDLGMEPFTFSLAHSRLAPVQCVTWGHPVTTGLLTIDYYLSSRYFEPPEGPSHYTEQLVLLEALPTYFYRPAPSLPLRSRAELGLAAQRHLYLCPQSLFKLHPDFDPLLRDILRQDPEAELWLVHGLHPHWDDLLKHRFQQTIPEASDRLRFIPPQSYQDYLNLLAVADVVLDTIHFGGGTTSLEALAVGAPVVTLPSSFMRGRMTMGCYRRMGVPDCIAASPQAYVDLAVRLATDPAYRQTLRDKILSANHQLYEDQAAVRAFEQFFKQVVAGSYGVQTTPAPASPAELIEAGLLYHQNDNFHQAEQLYQQVLRLDPDHAPARHLLGLLAQQQGQPAAAVAYLQRALASNSDDPEIHRSLALILRENGRLTEAVDHYRHASMLKPTDAETYYNLGTVLAQCRRYQEAADAFAQAVSHQPNFGAAHHNLGLMLEKLGRLAEAQAALERVTQLQPENAAAWNNLGSVHKLQGQPDQAIACYHQALHLDPVQPAVHYNLGSVYQEQELLDKARAAFRQATRFKPEEALWHLKMAQLCPSIMPDQAAIERWRTQFSQALDHFQPSSIDLTQHSTLLLNSGLFPPFQLPYHGLNDLALKARYAALFSAPPPLFSPRHNRPYRLGFLVTRNHEGIFLNLMRGILDTLDDPEFSLTVICSEAGLARLRQGIQSERVAFLPIPYDLETAAVAIRAGSFDLIWYWEVGSDTLNYFLPFYRLAPVQVTSWGLSVTTGVPQLDYFISSTLLETDEAEAHYSEKLVKLKTLPTYFYRPTPPAPLKSRTQLGLPAKGHLYLCPQNLLKVHPDFDPVLAEILRRDPQGRLIFLKSSVPQITNDLSNRFQAALPDVMDRVMFTDPRPWPEYLNLLAASDVLLDPFHYSGGNTTHEALALGLPIVTMPTHFLRGRLTLGRYQRLGLMDCVVTNPEAYVDLAVTLGKDEPYRAALRAKILAASEVLYEDTGCLSELSYFFRAAIEQARGNGQQEEGR